MSIEGSARFFARGRASDNERDRAMNQPKIMYYHDGRHPHIYRYEPPMAPEEYIALVDELAGTTVEAIAFCLGEGRTMLHDTRAGELMGHNVEVWDHHVFRRAWQNAQVPHRRWPRPLALGLRPGP